MISQISPGQTHRKAQGVYALLVKEHPTITKNTVERMFLEGGSIVITSKDRKTAVVGNLEVDIEIVAVPFKELLRRKYAPGAYRIINRACLL